MPELIKPTPTVDPNVQYVGVSKLRKLNATTLRSLDNTLVIQDPDDKPLAVVLSYDQFLDMQQERERILETLEIICEKGGSNDLIEALQQTKSGNVRPFSLIRKTLREEATKTTQVTKQSSKR
jgi:hypothetical protein